eukprot:CFRG1688T1
MSIEIPLHTVGDEVLEIQLDNLPDEEELVTALTSERVPLKVWVELAQQYYLQKKFKAFVYILRTATDTDTDGLYEGTSKEKVMALNSLAFYYIQQAESETEQVKKDDLIQDAIQLYNRSDRIDLKSETTWIGKGLIHMLRGDMPRAETQFNTVIEQSPNNVPALLGRANLFQIQKKYHEALELYKTVLKNYPGCPANVRLGIGQCYFSIGRYAMAKLAFQRTLDLDNSNIGALTGLAVLNLNGSEADDLLKGMRLIKHGYDLDPQNAIVLNVLANHYFHRGELDKCFYLSNQAMHNTNMDDIKADSCYNIARVHQKVNDYDQALNFYFKANKFNPELIVAAYGLGQMYLYKNELKHAAGCFETVLKAEPDNYECTKMLASIYGKTGKQEKAREYFKKVVTEFKPNDADAWVEYSIYLEDVDPIQALVACETAEELLRDKVQTEVPAELWNNIATLQVTNGKLESAYKNYNKALKACEGDNEPEEVMEYLRSLAVTITYNLARLHELNGNRVQAETMYKDMVKEHPSYIESYLRLGCMYRDQGRNFSASSWFKEALSVDTGDFRTRSLLGNLHLSKGENQPAQKMFDSINKDCKEKFGKEDIYSLVALGSLFHQSATLTKPEKHKYYLDASLAIYTKALTADSRNVYAANGIGCVLAEKGFLNDARQIFVQVREATGDMPYIWMNLAHACLHQKQYINAIKMLKTCQARFFGGRDVDIYASTARAYFLSGDYTLACKTLRRALHIDPTNQEVEYNLGLCEQHAAVVVLKNEKAETSELMSAMRSAKASIRIFTMLKERKDKHPTKYSKTRADREARMSADLLKQCEYHYGKQKVRETKRAMDLARTAAKTQEWQSKKDKAREVQLRLQEEEVERMEKERHALVESEKKAMEEAKARKELENVINNEKKAKKGAGGGKRKRKNNDMDDFIDHDLGNNVGGLYNSDSDEDVQMPGSGYDTDVSDTKRKKRRGSGSGNDEGLKKKGRKLVRGNQKTTHSKEFIEDSDEEAASGKEEKNITDRHTSGSGSEKDHESGIVDREDEDANEVTTTADLFGDDEDSD